MKRIVASFIVLAAFAAHHALAQSVTAQPLTCSDCSGGGMVWDDNANVCGEALANASAQPLTKAECVGARQTWNESANVCDRPHTPSASPTANSAAPSSILVTIDKAKQRMVVLVDEHKRFDWPVSTGRPAYATPSGSYTASSMNEIWYSKQWDNAPMPHAVFFTKEGHAIHGTTEVKRLGKPASHGCVRISPQNAATLYALVEKIGLENTQIILAGLTPGGEGKIAANAVKPKPRSSRSAATASSPDMSSPDVTALQSPPRGGLFKRLFGGR